MKQSRVPNAYDKTALRLEVKEAIKFIWFYNVFLKNAGWRHSEGDQNEYKWSMGGGAQWKSWAFSLYTCRIYRQVRRIYWIN